MDVEVASDGIARQQNRPGWVRTVREEAIAIALDLGNPPVNVDMEFLAFLRVFSQFGVFRYGPVTIAVAPVEEDFWRVYETQRGAGNPPWDSPDRAVPHTDGEIHPFFTLAWKEARAQGRRALNELDYLLTFMKHGAGLPLRVFGELGVSPERVRAFAAQSAAPAAVERLYSPEEAAQYFGVRVETVRSWVRSGRLPAARLAGLKSIRIREGDLATVLDPISPNAAAADDR